MKTIAHLSDLHFGAEDPAVVAGLLADLAAIAPDLVVVSGDLTQRARRSQFEAARDFLAEIASPKLVVPGNHDIPLFDVVRRTLHPFGRFRLYIEHERLPWYDDGEVAAVGMPTPRRNRWKEGRVSLADVEAAGKRLCSVSDERLKLLVTHHPFVPKAAGGGRMPVQRGEHALGVFGSCGADLLLSGHQHVGRHGLLNTWYPDVAHSVLVVEAGTAVSRRRRGDPNEYNRIESDGDRLLVETRAWSGGRFAAKNSARFAWQDDRWHEE